MLTCMFAYVDRSHWGAVKCDSFDGMRKLRLQQWREVSAHERLQAAWELSVAAFSDHGSSDDEDEPRLQRTVTNFQRGER